MHTSTCPKPSRGSLESWDPPFLKPISPQPAPPPTLLAGVGVAPEPPETEVRGWLWGGDSGIFGIDFDEY